MRRLAGQIIRACRSASLGVCHRWLPDVRLRARRFGKDVLLARAAQIDAGFDIGTLAGGPLGSGDIDFPAMIHALAEAGFDGYLVVEHEAHVFVDKRGPAAVLADGHAFAEKLIHGTLPRNRT